MLQQSNPDTLVPALPDGCAGCRRYAGLLLICAWLICAGFAPPAVAADASSSAARPGAKGAAGSSGAAQASGAAPVSKAADSAQGGGEGPFSAFKFSANNGPIQIRSNTLSVDYKSKLVQFQGDVHASQSGTTLTSKILKVVYGDKFDQIQTITAQGDVKVVQGGRWVTGQQAVLDEIHHTLDMTGNPVIHDGPDKVAGSRIIVYLDSQKSFVEGASAMIYPHASTDGDHEVSTPQQSPLTK